MDRVVGGYRLERRLGKGGMGEVWLGRHGQTGGIAAIKMLRDGVRDKVQELFARERRAIARLSHPHIVALYEVGPDYLITAYVHGPDLQHRMRVPLQPALALRIARQIASALEHAHSSGVVHRDVKPSNILLDEEENAYLADFGVARLLDEEADDVGAGTPAFMAPEQTRGELATPLSDQYALGRTLLSLLVGDRLPDHPAEALALLPPGLPPELRAILWRATAVDPEQRYPTMGGLRVALDTMDLSGSTVAPALLALRRSVRDFEWSTRPVKKSVSGVDLQRADYRLSQILDEKSLDQFRHDTGYEDFGWAVWARSARLGPVDRPEALARATEVVVLVHGYLCTRDSWDGVAQSICRDNGHTVVLVPDLHGFGESRFRGMPIDEHISPRGTLEAVRRWLSLIGLADVPTVLVGHSAGAVAVLSARDAELGPQVHRVAVTPVFPFAHPQQRRGLRAMSLLLRFLGLFPSLYERSTRFIYNRREVRERYDAANRERLTRLTVDIGPRVLARLVTVGLSSRPADGDALERCLIVVTPDDPIVPEELVKHALLEMGFPSHKLHRLAKGGHFPHAQNDEHPEWTNRNVDDIVGVIDAVLDATRAATTGVTAETVQSSPRSVRLMSATDVLA